MRPAAIAVQVIMLNLLIGNCIAFAQTATSSTPASRSLTEQIMEKSKRLHDYINLINDKDAAIRLSALEAAVKDPDPVARGMALRAYLKRYDALTPEIVLDPGSSVGQEDVPRLAVVQVTWSDEGNFFVGQLNGCGGVRGQIAGGKLAINYDAICIRSSLLTKDVSGNKGKGDQLQRDSCQLTMAPNEQGDILEGVLHCVGVSDVFKVQLPFGA